MGSVVADGGTPARDRAAPTNARMASLIPLLVSALWALFTAMFAAGPADAESRVIPTAATRVLGVSSQIGPASAEFAVRTANGTVTYRWSPDRAAANGSGDISATLSGDARVIRANYVPAFVGREIKLLSTSLRSSADRGVLTHVFSIDGVRTTLVVQATIVNGSLVLDLTVDRPALFALGVSRLRADGLASVSLPYNPVALHHFAPGGPFSSIFLDWTASAATLHNADGALYEPKTDGSRNPARERLVFTLSPQVAGVLPNPSWPRSRYYDRVGGRLVVDVTETVPFADLEKGVDGLIDAGLSDCILIVHVWQRLGYDDGFPVVLPANAFLGGSDALKRVGAKAKSVGCEFALHQNYIDHYLNSGTFDSDEITLDASKLMTKAWLNTAVGQQSYAVKPGRLAAAARRYAPAIKSTLGTTASFIDVNSSMAPWQRVDMDSSSPDGGRFAPFLAGSKALFDAMQSIEQGPVFGEGDRHFYWTGAVDGVEAQMTPGYPGDVRQAPLWVDFDLLKIGPYQHNYGMGFYNRYAPATATSRDPMTEETTRDVYRTQQIAFGHLPYRSETLWADVRLFAQEAGLAGPVARAYSSTAVSAIRYSTGNRWEPIETALTSSAGQSVRVRYANGLTVTANTAAAPLIDARRVPLSAGGWSAYGGGVAGWSTTVVEGRRDFMQDKGSIYADPRAAPGNWSATATGDPGLVDFGPVRTNGQTWLRCAGGYWTLLGFAQRGHVDVEVQRALIAAPPQLRANGAPDVMPAAATSADFWRVRLTSGRRYTTPIACQR
jgi:Family of unknown function (DUF5696)